MQPIAVSTQFGVGREKERERGGGGGKEGGGELV